MRENKAKGAVAAQAAQAVAPLHRENQPTPIAEQWSYLRFLGFGAWWAWIWLCYNSTEIMRMFPAGDQAPFVLQMYLFSTAGIAASMFVAAALWKRATRLIDSRSFVMGVAALASLFTLLLGYSVVMGGGAFFAIAALLTGVGTSILCLRVGRIYGSISLGDSLTAGGISLLFAAFLYFVGVGIPAEIRLFFIADNADIMLTSTKGRAVVFNTALVLPKTTRDTIGVQCMTLKTGALVENAYIVPEEKLSEMSKYVMKSIPAAGCLAKDITDPDQLTL